MANHTNYDKIKWREEELYPKVDEYIVTTGKYLVTLSNFCLFLGVHRRYFDVNDEDSCFNRKTDPVGKTFREYLDSRLLEHNLIVAQDNPKLQQFNIFLFKNIHHFTDKREVVQTNNNINRVVDGLADEE